MGIIALASFLVAPLHRAFAPLLWHPELDAVPHPLTGSKSTVLAWVAKYPTGCEPNRLMVRYDKSPTPPDAANTADGFFLAFEDTDVDELVHNLLHANTDYAYTIYACTSEFFCSTICSASSASASDYTTTEPERWLATSIHGYDEDTDVRILDPGDWTSQAGPDVYRHTSGAYEDQAGVFFIGEDTTSNVPVGLYVMHTEDTAWQTDWNTATWDSPIMIASGTDAGDFMGPRNIIVVPSVDDENDERLTLFVTNADSAGNPPPTWSILHSATSLDEDGDDFGLCCSTTGDCSSTADCTKGGYTQVCCDFEDTGADVREEYVGLDGNCLDLMGWHGHDLWDDMGPSWDRDDDELTILFSGDQYSEGDCENCAPEGGTANIDMWRWDTGGGCYTGDPDTAARFCLEEVEEDYIPGGEKDWCPDEKVLDRHDPFSVPYPYEKKVYWKEGEDAWYVAYTSDNGQTFDDVSEVEFFFDDTDAGFGLGDPLYGGCIDDPASIIWKDGPTAHEMMVIVPSRYHVNESQEIVYRCFCTQDEGVDSDDPGFETYEGLFTAVLTNG